MSIPKKGIFWQEENFQETQTQTCGHVCVHITGQALASPSNFRQLLRS